MERTSLPTDAEMFTDRSVARLREYFETTAHSFGKPLTRSETCLSSTNPFNKTNKIIEELFASEVAYVKTLRLVIENYIPYLNINNKKVTEIFAIFINLFEVQEPFLTKLLQNKNSPEKIAKCFMQSQCLFQFYEDFIKNQAILSELLSTKYAKTIQKRRIAINDPLRLLDHLLTPFQRLTRYKLLLTKLLAEASGNTWVVIQEAVTYLDKLTTRINENIS